jgi:hypothetical protein
MFTENATKHRKRPFINTLSNLLPVSETYEAVLNLCQNHCIALRNAADWSIVLLSAMIEMVGSVSCSWNMAHVTGIGWG